MLGLAIGLAGCGEASGQQKEDSRITQLDRTLWQTIDALAQQIPFSKAKVETVLGVGLVDRDTSNDVFPNMYTGRQDFEGGPVKLSDGVEIVKIDLRTKLQEGDPGFLVLNFAGACIGLDAVRAHYSDLKVTGYPRGDSLDEVTS
jgi:hypothetical protein